MANIIIIIIIILIITIIIIIIITIIIIIIIIIINTNPQRIDQVQSVIDPSIDRPIVNQYRLLMGRINATDG